MRNQLSDDEAKEMAKQLFLSEAVPVLQSIAAAVGIDRTVVGRWRDAENWQMLRHELYTKRAQELEHTGCDPRQLAIEDLQLCKQMKSRLKEQLKSVKTEGYYDVNLNLTLITQLQKIRDVQRDCLKQLGQI